MMTMNEIEIEMLRSLQGTHQYEELSSGRGIRPASSAHTTVGAEVTRSDVVRGTSSGPSITSRASVSMPSVRSVTGVPSRASVPSVPNRASMPRAPSRARVPSLPNRASRASVPRVPSGPITASTNVPSVPSNASAGAAGEGVLYPELSYAVVGALIEVHRWLGPGQLESVYQRAVEKELGLRKIPCAAQVSLPARYKGEVMGELVLDVIVDDAIVLELKAVERVLPVHRAQLISYLHASDCRLGMLVNFHVPVMIEGIKRIAL